KKTELKDVLQGVMRMRQFSQAQTIDIILPPEIIQWLPEKNMKGILDFTRKNQEETLVRQHYVATLKKIHEVFKKDLDGRLKNKTLTRTQKLAYYDAFSEFFVNTLKLSPYRQMGGLETTERIATYLEDYQKDLLIFWKTVLEKIKITVSKEETDKVTNACGNIVETMKPFLPDSVSKQTFLNRSNADTEMQSQKQAQRHQQTQQQQQQQAQQQQHTDNLVGCFLRTVTHTAWSEEMWNDWCAGLAHSKFEKVKSYLNGESVLLQLSEELNVSQNFLDTFENLKILHFKAKKPMEYVLMRQSNHGVKAQIITQIEADELLERIKKMNSSKDLTVWIETVNGSLYAGDFPKNYPQMPMEYDVIKEQLYFLNGDIEILAENIEQNKWFSPDAYIEKMAYFKTHIAPDEALNAQNLSFVEDRLLKKLARPSLEVEQDTQTTSAMDESVPQELILHYSALKRKPGTPQKNSSSLPMPRDSDRHDKKFQ
ncbi:MAG TPA: hypothetical protein PK583_02760, partial [Gammaproteobacteria bacterium]|nr:hypothetical protein [Gammaproteobacteria bacterium]